MGGLVRGERDGAVRGRHWGCNATDPFEVAEVIHHAVTVDRPELRYRTSWGGDHLVRGRERMTDADWVSLGTAEGDDEYYARFEALFGLDIRPAG